MIEIGEKSKLRMTYADAVFYCFCLGDGWRLPTRHELVQHKIANFVNCWYQGSVSLLDWEVIPVRDLKDD